MYRAEDELLDKLILSDEDDDKCEKIDKNKIVNQKNLNKNKKDRPSGNKSKPSMTKKDKIEKKDEGKKEFDFFLIRIILEQQNLQFL